MSLKFHEFFFQLQAEDIPPEDSNKPPKCVKYLKNNKVFSDQIPETKEEVYKSIDDFTEEVAISVEKELRKRFINVYENRNFFRKE